MLKDRKQLYVIIGTLVVLLGIILYIFGRYWNFTDNEKEVQIEMIIKTITDDNDFWPVVMEGSMQGAKDYNCHIRISGPRMETDIEEQNRLVRAAIERKPDIIILAPADYTQSLEVAKEVKAAGIVLILLDSQIEESIEDVFVGTDNIEAGRKLGELLLSVQKENVGGKVGIISHVARTSSAIARQQGLIEVIQDTHEVLPIYYSNSNKEQAREITLQLLEEHPDVRAVIGLNEWASVGMAKAVKEKGMLDRVTVLGFDNSILEAKLLEEGTFQGIVIQRAFNMGYLSVEQGIRALENQPLQRQVDSGSSIITRENMYTSENEKLMFRFSE